MSKHPTHNSIANFIVDKEWFQSQETSPDRLPTDNWRFVKDTEGRTAILYIVLFHSNAEAGEPRSLPNVKETVDQEGTLPKLARLHTELAPPKFGPFIALGEVSDNGGIVNVRVWNIAAKLTDGVKSLTIKELHKADFSFPRMVDGS